MVADGYDDCEGDICCRVRESVGPDVTIGAEFDLHMHPTPALMASTDAIVIYKECEDQNPVVGGSVCVGGGMGTLRSIQGPSLDQRPELPSVCPHGDSTRVSLR